MNQITALDNKVSFLLGAASVLVGTVLASQGSALSFRSSNSEERFLHALPVLVVLFAFLTAAIAGFMAYRIQVYLIAPSVRELYENYLDKAEQTVKADVFRALVEASESNKRKIDKKAFWTNFTLSALAGEAVTLVVALLVHVIAG